MKSNDNTKRFLGALLLGMISLGLSAQEKVQKTEFKPYVGQAGKDVIWVPTPDELVRKMLDLAKVTSSDILVDLGSGDGRTVIAAAKLNAMATGVEYNQDMVDLSKKKAADAGVSSRAKFVRDDLFTYDLSNATVITMFLLPDINLRLRPKLLELKPGTRIVSNTFTMGEWRPDAEVTVEGTGSWNTALLWIVPARFGGKWNLNPGELDLNQTFQMVTGTFKTGKDSVMITDGRITGDKITFKIEGAIYEAKLKDLNTMLGTVKTSSAMSDFSATRISVQEFDYMEKSQ